MPIVGAAVLHEFGVAHGDVSRQLNTWLTLVRQAHWRSLLDVRLIYPQADYVKPHTVFNIKGNMYRLITIIDYGEQKISVVRCLTHADYDREGWK